MTSRPTGRSGFLLLAFLAAACSKPAPPAPQPVPADSAAMRARADSLARAMSNSRADSVRAQVMRDSADAAARTSSGLDAEGDAAMLQTLYFETDRSDLSAESQRLLDRKVALLRANPRLEIQVEGHCDDRGPDEYNLALGNRRAASVKRYLVEHGIAAARLTIVSYGEERPAVQGATETAWARNRRAEFAVTRSAR